ncbi:MAG: vitamin B12-dependent ribonucleotide reductase [Kiritimatiellia bacterium]
MLDARGAVDAIETRSRKGSENTEKAKENRTASRPGAGEKDPGLKTTDNGVKVQRRLTAEEENPFDSVEWERRKASIAGDAGKDVFTQDNVEVPKSWSMLATNVVASKYFYGGVGTNDREYSARQLIHRVVRTITDWGLNDGYFASPEDAENFYGDLSYVCLHQYGAFNSPVWFNVGLYQIYGHSSKSRTSYRWDEDAREIIRVDNTYKNPQASACFIQSVEDTMEDIMRLASCEAMLFKYGSGTGTDLSTLRSSREKLSGGGTPSGPLSFMRVFDQVAAVIKSGGKTRRAAKMQSLKVSHPDIVEFINCKKNEEKKAWGLIEQGYDGSLSGEAYESVMFQNANLSVRVTDDFMNAAENDEPWETRAVLTGEKVDTHQARDLLRMTAEGTHVCGDPGLQYDTTINRWHTCPDSGRINASNPCSEFMFLDNSACNLASVNLMKFVDENGNFNIELFKHVTRLFIIAQDILVDNASYPTVEIAENSHVYRPLGLGYANLGAVAMSLGMPYDSDQGRAFAGAVTALMTANGYSVSQELAQVKGSFADYGRNRDAMINVMKMHRGAVGNIDSVLAPAEVRKAAEQLWNHVVSKAPRTGFRNSQVTLLAPTGTIGFMMDCDTTGVEPDIALVKYKKLAGGGTMKIVNRTIRPALTKLGYTEDEMEAIIKYVDENDTIEGAPNLKSEDLPVFDCAFKARQGKRYIHYKAHLKMMAAVQPFLSGSISKTVNIANDATVNDIAQAYVEGWKLGLKSLAMYRDGSKRIQPLNTGEKTGEAKAETPAPRPFRRRMPLTRNSITHKFEVAGHEGYLTVGIYEDGRPGELFITMAKEGSTVGGTMDSFGTAISLCLQYGVPIKELVRKFAHSRFEPSGFTKNSDIPMAKSIVDYIFRWLDHTFPDGRNEAAAVVESEETAEQAAAPSGTPVRNDTENKTTRVDLQFRGFQEDAPACDVCGAITVRNGSCYRCYNCGNSMGCS